MFHLAGSDFAYDKEDCQDHEALLLKHQDQCLVTVMQNIKYSRKINQIYLEWKKWKIRGSSKSSIPSNVL